MERLAGGTIGCVSVEIGKPSESAEVEISCSEPMAVSICGMPTMDVSIWQDNCRKILVGITPMELADVSIKSATSTMDCIISLVCSTGLNEGFFLYVEEGRVVIEEGYAKVFENVY